MSRRKTRIRLDRLFMLIFIVLLVLSLLGFGGYFLINYINSNPNEDKTPSDITDDVQEEVETIKMELVDYDVYLDDNNTFGFNFIIADIKFSTNKEKLNFELDNLQTSEKVKLSETKKYIDKVTSNEYDLSRFNLNTSTIKSDSNNAQVCLFIPVESKANLLKLFNLKDTSKVDFDLDLNNKLVSSLKLQTGEVIELDDNLNVYVSSCSISSHMLHNGEDYPTPDTLPVYTFVLNVEDVSKDVKIVDAKFIKDGSSEEHDCLDESYSSLKQDNIINKTLKAGLSGALFFQIQTNDMYYTYDGILLIKLSNNDDWIKVSTQLR